MWILLGILLFVASVIGIGFWEVKVILFQKRFSHLAMIDLVKEIKAEHFNYVEQLERESLEICGVCRTKLQAYYYPIHQSHQKIVVMVHGYTGNHYQMHLYIPLFAKLGYNIVTYDARAHGCSKGGMTSFGHFEEQDLAAIVNYFQARYPKAEIGLFGQSMGAATVMLYGGKHSDQIAFIIEDCGYSSAKETLRHLYQRAHVPFFPLYGLFRVMANVSYHFDFSKVNVEAAIVSSRVPTLFIHGKKDDTVPYWMATYLYERKKGKYDQLFTVDEANHLEAYTKDERGYSKAVQTFIESLPH